MTGKWLVVGAILLVAMGGVAFFSGLAVSEPDDPVTSLEALKERRVIYLEDEHVFLVFNHGKPLALSDDAQHIGDRVEFCESSQMFESAAHGEKFDLRGYYYGGPGRRGLDRYPVRIEGDAVNVDLYEPIPGPGRGDPPALGPAGPLCFP